MNEAANFFTLLCKFHSPFFKYYTKCRDLTVLSYVKLNRRFRVSSRNAALPGGRAPQLWGIDNQGKYALERRGDL
jgi:hypothetical protein